MVMTMVLQQKSQMMIVPHRQLSSEEERHHSRLVNHTPGECDMHSLLTLQFFFSQFGVENHGKILHP